MAIKTGSSVLGEGQQPPPHQLGGEGVVGGLGERCELPQRGSGAQKFSTIFSTQGGPS